VGGGNVGSGLGGGSFSGGGRIGSPNSGELGTGCNGAGISGLLFDGSYSGKLANGRPAVFDSLVIVILFSSVSRRSASINGKARLPRNEKSQDVRYH
jgi:hypothetical protein